jgi:hypothetical protein
MWVRFGTSVALAYHRRSFGEVAGRHSRKQGYAEHNLRSPHRCQLNARLERYHQSLAIRLTPPNAKGVALWLASFNSLSISSGPFRSSPPYSKKSSNGTSWQPASRHVALSHCASWQDPLPSAAESGFSQNSGALSLPGHRRPTLRAAF